MAEEQQDDLHRLTFEQAMEKLETTVSAMEQGGVPLDEMISKFEEGAAIANYCQGKLASLKKKMEILVKDRDNKASWQEMEQ
jgi:exodeoxyribonuclease VII, small subunit